MTGAIVSITSLKTKSVSTRGSWMPNRLTVEREPRHRELSGALNVASALYKTQYTDRITRRNSWSPISLKQQVDGSGDKSLTVIPRGS